MKNPSLGTLYVVATPIGNLQDITLRAIEVLKKVDWLAAEDTRRAQTLLQHFSIQKPTISLHEFNERERSGKILTLLQQGESIALIADAGTPLINDPGFYLVRTVRELGMAVVPIPGACAAIAALSVAGLPTDRFTFEGFLPVKSVARQKVLQALQHETRTMIFYEAPHRILSSLKAIQAVFGAERQAVVARELTKIYETIRSGTMVELVIFLETHANEQRGEFVILVEGGNAIKDENKIISEQRILDILLDELPLKQAVTLASKITGAKKNALYRRALSKKDC